MRTEHGFPRVSIIILNWNGWKDTIECLESLYRITYSNYDVIVVDNGSKDDSVQKIKEYAEGKIKVNSKFFDYNPNNKPIKVFEVSEDDARRGKFNRPLYEKFDVDRRMILIKNKDNYGFTGGNNIGIKFALSVLNPEYVLLLNNDTVVDRNFLRNLLEDMPKKKNRIGIVSPKVLKYHNPSIIDSTGHIFNGIMIIDRGKNEIDVGQYDNKNLVLGAIAAAALYKKDMILQIGLFDETFETNYEDAEYSWRANKFGWLGIYIPTSVVYHKRGATINKTTETVLKISKNYWRNSIIAIFRYAPVFSKIVIILPRSFILIRAFLMSLLTGNSTSLDAILQSLYETVSRLKYDYRRVKYL
ncbi:glycosyl transferase, group 2 family protein [Pyrococcus yayanosii CH1]|uniref:Glycosyl transferase, group 2 family protein n=2 Tax=Pyrococcus TaxID=2260 RepID=F8AHP5_PYRYC|nr:glycosyl transferase, group 2 family protein [Pyrococcus yayanosii CH1]